MSAIQPRTPVKRARHHHTGPDTTAHFHQLAAMPDGPDKARLQNEVVAAWLPMAHRLAHKYRNRGESVEDLEQIAALALVKAAERYDPSRGSPFEPYAIPTVMGELKRHFRDNMWDLHVPRKVQNLRNKVRVSIRELSLTEAGARSPTVAEVAEHSGLSEEDVQLGMEALHGFNSLSLEAELSGEDGGFSLLDTLSSEDSGYDRVIDRETVRSRLRCLPERERQILYLRFFCEMSQARIAAQLGISQMHVSRLIRGACLRIRKEIDADPRAGEKRPTVNREPRS